MGYPDILLVVVDCLGWIPVSLLVAKERLPTLAKLCEGGVVFDDIITSSTFTSPAFASLITGVYPPRHGIMRLKGNCLRPQCPRVIQDFRKIGFSTYAWVTGPLHPALGLADDWDVYEYREPGTSEYETGDAEFPWLGLPESRPWLGLFHVWGLHKPRYVQQEYDSKAHGKSLYDRALRTVDSLLSRIVSTLDLDTTVLIILGDHGENVNWSDYSALSRRAVHAIRVISTRRPLRFLRNGHGIGAYEDLIRIPFIVVGCGLDRSLRSVSGSIADVLPTVAGLLRLPIVQHQSIDGMDLWARPCKERAIPVFTRPSNSWPSVDGMRQPPWKLVRIDYPGSKGTSYRLHNLVEDPQERRDYSKTAPHVRARLQEQLDEMSCKGGENRAPSGDGQAELERRLEDLGYL